MLKLKICGNHDEADVQVLLKVINHLEHIGFIFTSKSKRRATVKKTREWMRKYPELAKKAVAVFLDQSMTEMKEILDDTGIRNVQLHGYESLEVIRELRKLFKATELQVWKVLHIERDDQADRFILERLCEEMKSFGAHVDAFLLDTQMKAQLGGTGHTFDWTLLPQLDVLLRASEWQPKPIWIAGGIRNEHIATIKQLPGVYGIDVASGVETAGLKDENKIRKLIEGVETHAPTKHVP